MHVRGGTKFAASFGSDGRRGGQVNIAPIVWPGVKFPGRGHKILDGEGNLGVGGTPE